jgi:hypothetical protein
MQSYNGTIRLFPNWPLERPAAFTTLRAVGAFLVSASCANSQIELVTIYSEAGSTLRIINPWKAGAHVISHAGETTLRDALIEIATKPRETVSLQPAR